MPTNFDLIRKRNHIPVRENRETSAVKTESRNSGLPKTKSGGIDWDAIRKRNGIRVESAQDDATRIRNKLDQVLSPSRTATVENSRESGASLLERSRAASGGIIPAFNQMDRSEEQDAAAQDTLGISGLVGTSSTEKQTPLERLQEEIKRNTTPSSAVTFTPSSFQSVYTPEEAESAQKTVTDANALYERLRRDTTEGGAYVRSSDRYQPTEEQRAQIEETVAGLQQVLTSNTASAIERELAGQYIDLLQGITETGNYAQLAAAQFALGIPSSIRNTATGISNMVGDIVSGGRLSESTKTLDAYFAERPELLQEIAQGRPVYTPAIAEETGVRQSDLEQYLKSAQDRAMQEQNYKSFAQNLNQGFAEFVGESAYSMGAQVPGMLLTAGANSTSPMWKKTAEEAKKLGYLIDPKTGNVIKNLNQATGGLLGKLADGESLKAALQSAFRGNFATYLIGASAAGGSYNELMRTEDYDWRNFLNAFGQGFAEYFTEGLFGFSDMASYERFFDNSIGSGTTRFFKGLLNWLSGGGEEALEEIVNAPLGELVNLATGKKSEMVDELLSWNPEFQTGGFQGAKALFGENGIFNLEDMASGGLSGFVTGAIMGMAGSVASTYESLREGAGIAKTVTTLNRFVQENLPEGIRPQTLSPTTASYEDVAAYTAQIQDAIVEYARRMKSFSEEVTLQAGREAGTMLPTAAEGTATLPTAAETQAAGENTEANDAQFSIAYTADHTPYVVVNRDILAGVPKKDWVKAVKDNMREKFPNGILVGNQMIKINAQTTGEITYSEYTKWLRDHSPDIYADKLRATDNMDEILTVSHGWVGESAKHSRNDNFREFARGNVLIQIGSTRYNADVVVATTRGNQSVLYDIVNLEPVELENKNQTQTAATTENDISDRTPASDSEIPDTSDEYVARLDRPSSTFGTFSNTTISQRDTGVNPSIRGRNTMDTYGGAMLPTAAEGTATLPTAAETERGAREYVPAAEEPALSENAGEPATASLESAGTAEEITGERTPGMLPTAAEAELWQRMSRARTELERSGIRAGAREEDIQTAQRLSNALGREIRFYDGRTRQDASRGANGYYAGGTIYVNSRSRNPVAQIISHELTHSVEMANAYRDLAGIVMQRIRQTGGYLEVLRQEQRELYARRGVELAEDAEIDREIVAEYIEQHLLTDEESILELTRQNRTLGQRILDWLDRLLARLGNKDAGERAFILRARDAYANALRQTQAQAERQETQATLRGLREDYAAGRITDEEFDEALDAVMEEESLSDRSMLDAQYSIEETKDGKRYVKADRQVIYGNDPEAWGDQVEGYINRKIRKGEDVALTTDDGDILLLTSATEGKASFRNYVRDKNGRLRPMSDAEYETKLNAETHIDELAQISERGKKTIPDEGGVHGAFAENGWNYRTAYFLDFDGKYYRVTLSVAQNSNGKVVYNVGDIQERTPPSFNGSSAENSGAQWGEALSDTTISQRNTGVNSSIRNRNETDTYGGAMLPRAAEDREYSISETGTEDAYIDDPSYRDAVQTNDTAMQQRLVQAAAEYAMPKSRARDKDGNLLKVYHGTKSFGFTVFDRSKTDYEGPFYFTSAPETAESYSGERGVREVGYPGGIEGNRGSGNYAVYLDIQNPLEVNCRGGDWDAIPVPKRLIQDYLSAFPDELRSETLDSPSIAEYAEYAGYDGVILRNIQDNGGNVDDAGLSDVYIAFSPYQIKSADPVTYDNDGKAIPLSERFRMADSDIRYSISENFAEDLEDWYYETDPRDRITDGGYLRIGTVSEPLKSIGVRDGNVYWRKSKIGTIMQDHPEIDLETAKNVPQILENPVVILKSRTQDNSITLFGDVTAANGERVMAALHLTPRASGNMETEFTLLASAYGRSEGNIRNLLNNSEVLYLDPNKNRTDTWLMSLGVQFPSDQPAYGPIGTITYHDGEVKISGVPYSQYMQGGTTAYTPQYSVSEDSGQETENAENDRGTDYDDRGEPSSSASKYAPARKKYSYEWFAAKPPMQVTTVDDSIPTQVNAQTRKNLVDDAMKNAASIGSTNRNGNVFIHVDDTDTDVMLSKNGLRHGLDRRLSIHAPVIRKAGEILKNAVRINELNPRSTNISNTYVLVGMAKNTYDEPYVVSFVVNRYTNEMESMDVLYAVNAKTEPAGSLSPGVQSQSDLRYLTGSTLTIADLLDYVNQYFPDILPEDVLRHYGYQTRPEGSLGENALFSMSENDRGTDYDDRGERWDGTFQQTGSAEAAREAEEIRRERNEAYQNYPWLYGTGKSVTEAMEDMEAGRDPIPGMLPRAAKDIVGTLRGKARDYVLHGERYLLDKAGAVLGVPEQAGNEYLKDIVREVSNEYLEDGRVSEETVNRLFRKAYEEGMLVNRAYYEQFRDLRDELRNLELTISPEDSADIPNFDSFLASNARWLHIGTGDHANIAEVYRELQRKWPALFGRDRQKTPAEQLQRIAQVVRSFETARHSLDGYDGQNANEFRRLTKHDFEAAIQDAVGELRTVRRYLEDRDAQERTEAPPATVEEVAALWRQVKDARRKYERVLARNLLTAHDEMQLGRLMRGEMELEHLDPEKDNVRGITAVYEARQAYERLVRPIRIWNQARKAALRQEADGYLQTANDWHDKRAGILYSRETMERNIRDIVPDEELAEEIIRTYFTPVHEAAAEANRMKNRYRDRVRKLKLSRKVAEGNLVSEAHAVQLLGEAEDNIRMLERSRGRVRTRDGKSLEEWRGVVKKLWEENPKLDAGKIRAAVDEFRKIYDELFEQMNGARIRNGYEPVNYRSGYFPHFQPGNGDGILAQFGRALGITTEVSALPTTINGLTHNFRPGIRWLGNAEKRLGFNTVYDAVEGFDRYIEGVSDVIHQTDNIQRLRALASQIRYRTGDEGIRRQVDAVLANPALTEEDKQNRMEKIHETGRYTLSNFAVELEEYTNLLANKKSRADRNMEQALGRRMYNLMKALESRVAANMVAINPASWLTNFVPLAQGGALLDRGMLLHGMWDTFKAYRESDGIVDRSAFLTNRRGSDPIVRAWTEASSAVASKPMEWIDSFVAASLVRARYRQNLGKGMSEDAAMQDADAFAASVMADRSKGAMPTLFYRANPLTKLFTQFQLEVNNTLSFVLKDIPREKRKKGLVAIAAALFQMFLGSWLYNELYEFIIGRRPALDPIGMLNDTVGDLTGWELPNLVELGVGAASGNLPSFQVEQAGLGEAGINLVENLAEQTPFIGGLIGGGRLPVSSAIPNIGNLWNAAANEDWSTEKRLQEFRDEVIEKPLLYLFTPFGGGQIKKIYEAIEGVIQGGSYTVNADGERELQFPIYRDTAGEAVKSGVQGALFGRTSLPTGRDWIERGFDTLSAKQTAVYEGLLDAGVPGEAAYSLIQELREAEKTQTESRAVRQRKLLEASDISDDGKSIVYYGLLASDGERELMDRLAGEDADMGEVAAALMEIKDAGTMTGAAASCAKRDAIAEAMLGDDEKIRLYRYTFGERQEDGSYASSRDDDIEAFREAGLSFDEFLKAQNQYSTINEQYDSASDKALEFARWADALPYTSKQKEQIKDRFRYYSQVPAEATRYEKFIDAGLSTDDAYELASALAELTPEAGKETVSNYQRYEAILDSGLREQAQLDAIGSIMGTDMQTESGNPSQYAKLLSALDEGVELRDWFDVARYKSEAKSDYDENGEVVKSAKEKVLAYIDGLDMTSEEKDALYLCHYAESTLSDAPWHSGTWSLDFDWSGIWLPKA